MVAVEVVFSGIWGSIEVDWDDGMPLGEVLGMSFVEIKGVGVQSSRSGSCATSEDVFFLKLSILLLKLAQIQ